MKDDPDTLSSYVSVLDDENNSQDIIKEEKFLVNQTLVHSGLMLGQVLNGCGAIVGKLGLKCANPILFALCREFLACPFFILFAFFFEYRFALAAVKALIKTT